MEVPNPGGIGGRTGITQETQCLAAGVSLGGDSCNFHALIITSRTNFRSGGALAKDICRVSFIYLSVGI